MNGGIAPASIQLPSMQVDLREQFKSGASGPEVRQDVSFDGKLQPDDVTQSMPGAVDPHTIRAAVDNILPYVEGLGSSLAISVD